MLLYRNNDNTNNFKVIIIILKYCTAKATSKNASISVAVVHAETDDVQKTIFQQPIFILGAHK